MKKTFIAFALAAQFMVPTTLLAATTAPVTTSPTTNEQLNGAAVVTEGLVKSLGVGAKQVVDSSISGVNKLTSEAINLFIFQGLIHILYWCTIFVLFYIVKKYVDFLQLGGMAEKKARAIKTCMLIISLSFFATQTMPHLMSITEAIVAPNIYVLKKGAEFAKDFQGVGVNK